MLEKGPIDRGIIGLSDPRSKGPFRIIGLSDPRSKGPFTKIGLSEPRSIGIPPGELSLSRMVHGTAIDSFGMHYPRQILY